MSTAIKSVLDHVDYLAKRFRIEDLGYVISVILWELGLYTNHNGYDFLITGIKLYIQKPKEVVYNGLYTMIARQYPGHITIGQIEHAIRSAINAAWKNHDEVDWICYFSPESDGKIKKPSNTEFISRIARVLELWKGCCEKYENKTNKEDPV